MTADKYRDAIQFQATCWVFGFGIWALN